MPFRKLIDKERAILDEEFINLLFDIIEQLLTLTKGIAAKEKIVKAKKKSMFYKFLLL